MKDRLIELLEKASEEAGKHLRENTKKILAEKGRFNSKEDIDHRNIYELKADYLLANGVIVPPCKVGDLLCVIYKEQILPVSVRTVYIARDGLKIKADYTNHIIYIKPEHFGKEVFYNFAEANAKLKEGKSDGT